MILAALTLTACSESHVTVSGTGGSSTPTNNQPVNSNNTNPQPTITNPAG
jgi:hypothetical protein